MSRLTYTPVLFKIYPKIYLTKKNIYYNVYKHFFETTLLSIKRDYSE